MDNQFEFEPNENFSRIPASVQEALDMLFRENAAIIKKEKKPINLESLSDIETAFSSNPDLNKLYLNPMLIKPQGQNLPISIDSWPLHYNPQSGPETFFLDIGKVRYGFRH